MSAFVQIGMLGLLSLLAPRTVLTFRLDEDLFHRYVDYNRHLDGCTIEVQAVRMDTTPNPPVVLELM